MGDMVPAENAIAMERELLLKLSKEREINATLSKRVMEMGGELSDLREKLRAGTPKLPTVAEVREKLLELGPRGQFHARSDVEDVLEVVRALMEGR